MVATVDCAKVGVQHSRANKRNPGIYRRFILFALPNSSIFEMATQSHDSA
jgi:hypothetical protein